MMRVKRVRRRIVAVLLSMLIGFAAAPVAHATGGSVLWVASSGTVGTGSSCASPGYVGSTHVALQDAIDDATAGDEIRVCSGTYDIGTTLTINKNLTISGQSYPLPILDGGNEVRIMDITSAGITVTIDRLHFRNGRVSGEDVRGGAIRFHPSAHLEVTDSHFINNRSMESHGGAIATTGTGSESGTMMISGSTFYRNHGYDGGAIMAVFTTGISSIVNSTFVENTAVRHGGAISGSFASITATNSTFIDNTAPFRGDATWAVALKGSLITNSPSTAISDRVCYFEGSQVPEHNISSDSTCIAADESTVTHDSLQIGFLAPWGGDTPTVTIGESSTARNAVDASLCSATDQRGEPRAGGACDAGAFEFQASFPSVSTSDSITLFRDRAIDFMPTFTTSGLTAPIEFRFAVEVNDDLPAGITMSTSGRISGTPATTSTAEWQVITVTDSAGNEVSTRLAVDNACPLTLQDGSYLIGSVGDLENFRLAICGLTAGYLQTRDIDWDGDWSAGYGWGDRFAGTYDGGGFSITGLTIEGGEYEAFISVTNGATIRDLELEVTVSGDYASAGLVGYADDTLIEDVHVSGSITTPAGSTSRGCLGGLAGETDNETVIRRSSFEGTVSDSLGAWNGGLIGCAYADSLLENSFFVGDVIGSGAVGGLVGWSENSLIRNSYAEGTVTGSGSMIGGLVGQDQEPESGESTSVIENSYASTEVQGASSVGSLVGSGNTYIISSSFWEAGLNGESEFFPIGELHAGFSEQPVVTATSPSDMKRFSFFDDAGWEIVSGWENAATSANIWGICNGSDRPYLLWEHTSSPCTPVRTTSTPVDTETTKPESRSTTPTPVRSIVGQPVGGSEVMVNGQRVSVSLTWASDNTIRGTIGGVNIALRFEESLTSADLRPVIVRGRSFRISLRGLQPESDLSAIIFSRPTKLGTYAVKSDGSIRQVVAVPSNRSLGRHRLRIKMVDQDGREIVLWLGIQVRGLKALESARSK